jgi:uncharacterized protein (DUF1697 family)
MLRGINLGKRRVPMAQLRELLTEAGYKDVATYVQSGNIVLSSRKKPATLERDVAALLEDRYGFAVPVTARSGDELAAVIEHDPIPGAAEQPKLYQVTFLEVAAPAAEVDRLRELAVGDERVAAHGREIYTFHPDGIARSKLANGLAVKQLGLATARNWRTVTTLRQMASEPPA